MDILAKLDELHAAGELFGFTIWPSKGGYQANVALVPNAWRVRHGATPSEAVAALFDDGPLELGADSSEAGLLAPPDVDEPALPDEAHEDAGIFD